MNEETFSKKDAELHSMLRHDLKNKLQVSLGYLQLLKDKDLTEQQQFFVEKALNSLNESNQLISEVREIRYVWDRDGYEVDLNKILEDAVSEYRPLAEEQGIDIILEGSDGEVIGNELYKNIFSNLIDNSMKHSGCNVIKIQVNEDEDKVIISVEDDGEGIPDGIKDNLFDFGVKKGDKAGAGLGLSYVKELLGEHGGSIEMKESELGGARFDIEFIKA